jgi:hypothetical protein
LVQARLEGESLATVLANEAMRGAVLETRTVEAIEFLH